jgi:phi LC3 family holin
MIKWLNQHPKWRNRAFWVSLVSAITIVINQVANLLGYPIEGIVGQAQEVALTIIAILAGLGIFLIPPQSNPETSNQPNQDQPL